MARHGFKTDLGYSPKKACSLPITLDFSATGTINDSLRAEQMSGDIDLVQAIYIDNNDNNAPFIITFAGTGQRVVAQPLTQGCYPIFVPGNCDFKAVTTQGIKIPIIFFNMPQPAFVWGPIPGVTVTPPLTNSVINLRPAANGANILVPGVAQQTIKVYRMFIVQDAGVDLSLGDDINGPVTWTGRMSIGAGGGFAFQASGIPWFTGPVGGGLDLHTYAGGSNIGGQFGFVQS